MGENGTVEQIKLYVDIAEQFWNKADIEGTLRNYDLAYELIHEPKLNYPITLTLLGLKADKLFKWKEYVEALKLFEQCGSHRLGDKNLFIELRKGQCFLELGNLGEAYRILRSVLESEGKEMFVSEDPKYLYFALTGVVVNRRVSLLELSNLLRKSNLD